MASPPPDRPRALRSPYNGAAWIVPPDATPEQIAALEARGFTRIVPVPMEALQRHTYRGQAYEVGAIYDCDEGDVATVEAHGHAVRRASDPPPAALNRGAYRTTEIGEGETSTTALTATPTKKKKK